MLFGALFSSYILLRVGAPEGFWPHGWLNIPLGTVNTLVLITSSITTVMAWASCKMNQFGRFKVFHACTLLLALTFVGIKSYEYHDKFTHYEITLKDGRIADGHLVESTAGPRRHLRPLSSRTARTCSICARRKAAHKHEEITLATAPDQEDGELRSLAQHLPGHLLHPHRPARPPRHRRRHRHRLPLGTRQPALAHATPSGSPTASRSPACSGTSWTWSGFFSSLSYT